jgi:riboflavin kinase/FMN adenylyltransferase
VVIGNFDGVHRGHQAVLAAAQHDAESLGLRLSVLTFDPHPAVVLGRQARAVLTTTARKVRLLQAVVPGISVIVKRFDEDLAALSPEEFAAQILRQELDARVVLVGENFRFGKGRSGDLATLKQLGKDLGFDARAEPLRGDQFGAYSSTRVRTLLAEGNVSDAANILGRAHFLSGHVVEGDKRGRTLGFPTANLEGVGQALPAEGVYAVHVFDLEATPMEFLASGVANLGARPTVDRPPALEVHLLDFDGELYGRRLGLTLLAHLRPTRKFDGIEALTLQIQRDADEARRLSSLQPPEVPL